MRTNVAAIGILTVLASLSATQAQEVRMYRSNYGLVARTFRLDSATSFALELGKEISGKFVTATVRRASRDAEDLAVHVDDSPIFILCDGVVGSERNHAGPLRCIVPNSLLHKWVIHVEFYEARSRKGSPGSHSLKLLKVKEETLKSVYEKSVKVTSNQEETNEHGAFSNTRIGSGRRQDASE